jgi:hypothetical protein
MFESRHNLPSITGRSPRAFLVSENSPPLNDRNLAGLLDFFGIPWAYINAAEISNTKSFPQLGSGSKISILSSASHMAAAMQEVQQSGGNLPEWLQRADSVFLYGFQDTQTCQNLLRFLTQELTASIRPLDNARGLISITPNFPDFAGQLSGLQVAVSFGENRSFFDLPHISANIQTILTAKEGTLFFSVLCGGVRFYLNASSEILDLQRPVTKYFDVKDFFCNAVPPVMYLKSAFADTCWHGTETSACLTVDDPILKSRYGFLHFSEALELMDKKNFATTIGFIPWNWRRNDPSTVQMFRTRADRVSISVHGCDHTASEFATRSETQLNSCVKTARDRMDRLRSREALLYDDVMIFPQGAFSPETGHVLKLNGFAAAVNTEVAPAHEAGNQTTIADVWDLAIMKYSSFPIFTRRYITHGIENFAFDQFLGKPCFIIAHHDAFRDHAHDLLDFIAKLNSLQGHIHWRCLGAAIDRTFRVLNSPDGTGLIQIYATNAVIENPSDASREVVVSKREDDPDSVKAVLVNRMPADYVSDGKTLRVRVFLPAHQTTTVRVVYLDRLELNTHRQSVGYGAKTRLRRYLSEFRDNYLSHSDLLARTAARATHRPKSPQKPV